MKTWIRNGLVCLDRRFRRADLLLDGGIIACAGEVPENAGEGAELYDAAGCRIVPGFLDIHTHGACGYDVNGANIEGFETIARFFASQGTTSWLCSVLTDTVEQTERCIRTARRFREEQVHGIRSGASLAGIHLEGPFLSAEYKGAMPERLLRTADLSLLRRYQELAGGFIRYITVSPEVEGVPELIPHLRDMGIVCAIGHSGADYETAWRCIRAGVSAATHTCNAMRLFHQHEPAILGAVLESDVYCEAICDGRHLHPGAVRLLLKAKGLDRVTAVTDSIMAAGLPDGEYRLGVNEVVVEDGDAKLKEGGVRAGSTLTTIQALRNLMAFTGESMERVLPLLTENPARLLGLWENSGSIAPGKDADLLILDAADRIVGTFVKGRWQQRLERPAL